MALAVGPSLPADAPSSAGMSPRGASARSKGGKSAQPPITPFPTPQALEAAMPNILGPLPTAAAGQSSKSSTPRSTKSGKASNDSGGTLRDAVLAAVASVYPPIDETQGGSSAASRPLSASSRLTAGSVHHDHSTTAPPLSDTDAPPRPPSGAVHVYAPLTADALSRTSALVGRLAQAAAAAAELAATRENRGKTAYVPEGPLFDFVFPAHVQHPKSAARLFAVGMFGPLDEDTGQLRGGVRGRRVLSDYELHALLDELADEDALSVCVPREMARGLQPEQKAEVLRSVRDIVPELPRVSPSQVSALLASVSRDAQGKLAFAELQQAIVRARQQRVAGLQRMYPSLVAAQGGGAPLSSPPRAGGRTALAPRFTSQEVHTNLLRSTAAREGDFGATGGPLALSVAMDGVLPPGVGGQSTGNHVKGGRHQQRGAPVGGRLAASLGASMKSPADAKRKASSGAQQRLRGALQSPLRSAGGFTLGGGGLRNGEESDPSFLDVRLKRGENARRRKAEQLLQRNSHKVVALGSSNSTALAANALLLRQEPPPDKPSFDATVALRGAGTGSYIHAPFSNTQAKKLVQR